MRGNVAVANWVGEGLSNKHIARELHLTEGTVKLHLHKVYQRLGVGKRTNLPALIHKQAEPE